MSDAPRLKAMLKAAMLDWEVKHPPTTLKDVAQRAVRSLLLVFVAAHWYAVCGGGKLSRGKRAVQVSPDLTRGPPTTVIEAIFLLFQEASVSNFEQLGKISSRDEEGGAERLRSPLPRSGSARNTFPKASTCGTSSSRPSEFLRLPQFAVTVYDER